MTNSISLNLCTSSTINNPNSQEKHTEITVNSSNHSNSQEKHAEITNVVAKPIYKQVIDIVKSICSEKKQSFSKHCFNHHMMLKNRKLLDLI